MLQTSSRVGTQLGLLLVLAALAPAPPAQETTQEANAKARIQIIQQALEQLDRRRQAQAGPAVEPEVIAWRRRLVDAHRDLNDKAALREAIESLVKHLKAFEEYSLKRYESGRSNATEVLDAKYQRLEAESWLEAAKAK